MVRQIISLVFLLAIYLSIGFFTALDMKIKRPRERLAMALFFLPGIMSLLFYRMMSAAIEITTDGWKSYKERCDLEAQRLAEAEVRAWLCQGKSTENSSL